MHRVMLVYSIYDGVSFSSIGNKWMVRHGGWGELEQRQGGAKLPACRMDAGMETTAGDKRKAMIRHTLDTKFMPKLLFGGGTNLQCPTPYCCRN